MVIVDTSVWIPFFNRPASVEKRTIDGLLDTDEVILVGVVLAELLQGCRSRQDREELLDLLSVLPYLDMSWSSWVRAGDLSSTLLRKGLTLPLSDLAVASLALEHSYAVYSLDRHFLTIPGLQLHHPAKP